MKPTRRPSYSRDSHLNRSRRNANTVRQSIILIDRGPPTLRILLVFTGLWHTNTQTHTRTNELFHYSRMVLIETVESISIHVDQRLLPTVPYVPIQFENRWNRYGVWEICTCFDVSSNGRFMPTHVVSCQKLLVEGSGSRVRCAPAPPPATRCTPRWRSWWISWPSTWSGRFPVALWVARVLRWISVDIKT